jgi:hypothetical protein
MGMFTTIIDPTGCGRELQIKCGYDDCDTYHVGDTVDWKIWPDKPGVGKLLDGVYESYSDRGVDDWVVIREHRIRELVPRDSLLGQVGESGLLNYFKIEPFERRWWTEAAWVRRELEEAKERLKEAEREVAFLGSLDGKTEEEIAAHRDKQLKSWLAESFLERTLRKPLFPGLLGPPREDSRP